MVAAETKTELLDDLDEIRAALAQAVEAITDGDSEGACSALACVESMCRVMAARLRPERDPLAPFWIGLRALENSLGITRQKQPTLTVIKGGDDGHCA